MFWLTAICSEVTESEVTISYFDQNLSNVLYMFSNFHPHKWKNRKVVHVRFWSEWTKSSRSFNHYSESFVQMYSLQPLFWIYLHLSISDPFLVHVFGSCSSLPCPGISRTSCFVLLQTKIRLSKSSLGLFQVSLRLAPMMPIYILIR
jgi:hypothetical protein